MSHQWAVGTVFRRIPWSVPQIRQEPADSRGIRLSDDAIEEY